MRKRLGVSITVLLLPLLANAAAAYGASSPTSPSDPSAGSPAGAIYQLPFEEGRADGAPKGTGGTGPPGSGSGGGSGEGGGEPSLYRSENNFGSSSEVPGAPAGGAGAGEGGGPGGSGGGSNGSGSGSGGGGSPGLSALNASELTDSGNTSPAANIGLLLLIAAIAIGVGIFFARANRLRNQN
jgi:hypothetical protein